MIYTQKGREVIGVSLVTMGVAINKLIRSDVIMYGILATVWMAVGVVVGTHI